MARGEVAAFTDAEVLQEILHRYRSIGRWGNGRAVYDLTRRIVPWVAPVTAEVLDATRALLESIRTSWHEMLSTQRSASR